MPSPFACRRLLVLGAGAVGGSIAGLLHEQGLSVVLVARGAHAARIRADGLRLALPERELHVTAPVVESVAELQPRTGDVALLATKLQDAEAIIDQLRAVAPADLPMVCAVNGVHGEAWAAERFEHVLGMMVWLPATHLAPGAVRLHTGACRGVLDLGGAPETDTTRAVAAALRDLLGAAGFDSRARDDILAWKRAKWITNLGGAAQALITDDWQRVAQAAQAEGEAVLTAAGVARVATETLLARVARVECLPVDGEARAGGSTWQSQQRGQPLESPWLEGALAELAAEVGVPAPINAALADAAAARRPLTAADVLTMP